jgi:ElaB/YqjD/DUF883 family membrane-anchored ribosome-binding protein
MTIENDAVYGSHKDAESSRYRPADQGWEEASEPFSRSGSAARAVVNAVKDHPVTTLAVGLGIGWLVYENTLGVGPRKRLRKLSRSMRGTVESSRSAARRAVRTLRRGAVEKTEAVQGVANDAVSQVRNRAGDVGRDLRAFVRERPLVAGLATLGAGVVVGVCLPTSRAEDAWMGETRDEVLKNVKQDASEVVERGKDIARSTVRRFSDDLEAEKDKVSGTGPRSRPASEESFRRDETQLRERPEGESFLRE